jgi:tetratricopeptide (TPR) repeat protein
MKASTSITWIMRVAFLAHCLIIADPLSSNDSIQMHLNNAISKANDGDFAAAQHTLETALQQYPHSVDATQLLGVVNFRLGRLNESISLLSRALAMDKNIENPGIVANYIEVLRSSGDLQTARSVGHTMLSAIEKHRLNECSNVYYNLGIVERYLNNQEEALECFGRAIQYNPTLIKAWHNYGELILKRNTSEAEIVLRQAIQYHPDDHTLHFMLGSACQLQNKLTDALDSYLTSEVLNDSDFAVKGNIAATLQSLGRTQEALQYYQRALPHAVNDAGLLNNYGALLGIMGRHEEEVHWLTEALKIQPTLETALVNLAGHYQDEGDLVQARELLRRAALAEPLTVGTHKSPAILYWIRQALMLSPVTHSWAQMVQERTDMKQALVDILAGETAVERVDVDGSLDRLHFYVSYHGLNDRELQDLVARVYLRHLQLEHYSPYVDPVATFPAWLHDSLPNTVTTTVSGAEAAHSATLHSVPTRRARVGFISKFLGVFEPHGMLLDGVMQYLPRDRFEVIALPIAEAGGKPLSPTVQTACDSVHPVALNYEHALATLQALRLDVLVFADTVSEPMNHFLARARLAPIHVRCVLYCVYCVLERPSLFCLSTFNVVHLCPEFTVAFDTLLRVFTTTIVLVQLCAEATIAFSVRICASFCHGPLIVLCVTFLLLCALQMAFWGNPITSGSHQIDYFISADVMEHPYRTRMPVTQEPYSEQVRVCVM